MAPFQVARQVFDDTFKHFERCGVGRRECQVLWTSSWHSPRLVDAVVHPKHKSHFGGFILDDAWLNDFWLDLARSSRGIRVQVHTHPGEAFHSSTDDEFPIVHTAGFLSLVIPDFGLGRASFDRAFLARLDDSGQWTEVPIADYLEVIHGVET